MKDIDQAKRLLNGKAFFRLVAVNSLIFVVSSVNVLVDSMYVGQYLGTDALAAVSYFSPVKAFLDLFLLIITGTQILSGNLIGAGKNKELNRLFFSSALTIVLSASLFAAVIILFRPGLGTFLHVPDDTMPALSGYIAGYIPGIPFMFLSNYLISLATYNYETRRTYAAVVVMSAVNAAGNFLLGGVFGITGVGLASTAGYIVSLMMMLPAYIGKAKLIHFERAGFDTKLLTRAMKFGLPYTLMLAGVTCKNYMVNLSLSEYAGNSGMAVLNIMVTICSLAGAIPAGCYTSYAILASIRYGEEDREGMGDAFCTSFRIGTALCVAFAGLMMALSVPMASLFISPDDAAYEMAKRMLLLTPTYIIPNLIFYLLLKSYQAQEKMLMVNIFSFLDPFLTGVFVMAALPRFGTDAVWLSATVVNIVLVVLLVIIAVSKAEKPALSADVLLSLDKEFGAPDGTWREYSITSTEDVILASEDIVSFCREAGVPENLAFYTGLCMEEMADNIIRYGFADNKKHSVDIRLVKSESLKLRFRDDCREFNPKERMEMLSPEDHASNIGLRLVYGLATDIRYYNTAGINTLMITV